MNFQADLAAKVIAGEKTVTRRLTNSNPRSPWFHGSQRWPVGKRFAICPGRGKDHIGLAVVVSARTQRLGHLSHDEAVREGFASTADFEAAFTTINGTYNPNATVWRIAFTLDDQEAAAA